MQGPGACDKAGQLLTANGLPSQQIFFFPLLIKTTNSTKQQHAQQQKHSF